MKWPVVVSPHRRLFGSESAGYDGHCAGCRQPSSTQPFSARTPGGSADLPTTLESSQRICTSERLRSTCLSTAGEFKLKLF